MKWRYTDQMVLKQMEIGYVNVEGKPIGMSAGKVVAVGTGATSTCLQKSLFCTPCSTLKIIRWNGFSFTIGVLLCQERGRRSAT